MTRLLVGLLGALAVPVGCGAVLGIVYIASVGISAATAALLTADTRALLRDWFAVPLLAAILAWLLLGPIVEAMAKAARDALDWYDRRHGGRR